MKLQIYEGRTSDGKTYYCFVLQHAIGFKKTELILYKDIEGKTIEYGKWRLCPYYGSDSVCVELEEGKYIAEVVQFDEPCRYEDEYILQIDYSSILVTAPNIDVWICQNRLFGMNCSRNDADIATLVTRGQQIRLTPNLFALGVDIEGTAIPRIILKRGEKVVLYNVFPRFPYNAQIGEQPMPENIGVIVFPVTVEMLMSIMPIAIKFMFFTFGATLAYRYPSLMSSIMGLFMGVVGHNLVDILFRRV